MQAVRAQPIFIAMMLALVALAWLSLALWGHSSDSGHSHHHGPSGTEASGINVLVVFVAGWTVMTVAMMLPTSLPLITLFRRLVSARPDNTALVTLLIGGYLTVWIAFGFVAYALNASAVYLVDSVAIFGRNAWIVGAGALFVAGAYQFTTLKYRCLDACRSPRSFISSRWRGKDEIRQSFMLGAQHGKFCVGCCWSLMLLMILVGIGSILWMLLLGGIMAIEKNVRWGRKMGKPLGASLLGLSFAVALVGIM
jgi:predicted metal-binding membrane protein